MSNLTRLMRRRPRGRAASLVVGLVLGVGVATAVLVGVPGSGVGQGHVDEKRLFDNERVQIVEYVFPPGFKGEEHEAPVNEFAYVLEGEFGVITKGQGKRIVRRGEVEWAPRGAVHYSVNESRKPARVLVVLLKER
jgi:quercetin dioxygenase-like cupin family protein